MTSQRNALHRSVYEALYYVRRAVRVRDVTIDGIRIQVDYRSWSPLLVHRVLADRYEVEERKLVPKVVGAEDRVLEIGGGVGLIAMICARIVGEANVFVYEANPAIRAAALANFEHNGMQIAIEHAAVVGNEYTDDSVTFFVSDNFWSSSLLDKGGKQKPITAPAVRLDALIHKHRPSVIIADVEGAEYDLFRTADLSSVNKLCVEFHTRYIGAAKVSELIRSLLERGFVLELEASIGEVLYFSRPGS